MESKRTGNIKILGIIYSTVLALVGIFFTILIGKVEIVELVTIFAIVILTLFISLVMFIMIIEMKEYKLVSDDWKHKHELKMVEISNDIKNIEKLVDK